MRNSKVLFLHGLDQALADLVVSAAPSNFEVTSMFRDTAHDEQVSAAAEADFIMMYRSKLTREILQSATRTQFIQLLAAGYDGIDMDLIAKLGIPCANNGGANSWAVADQTLLLMLSLYRRVIDTDKEVRDGVWQKGTTGLNTFEMANKVVGVFGLGNIGQKVAKRVQAFEAKVQYFSKTRLSAEMERELDVTYVEMDELFKTSDILSLHAPLTDDTKHLVDAQRLRSMKPTAILINTSRGAIIDEDALVEALKTGVIAGAGIDAFTEEPVNPKSALLQLDNVVLSPHSGGTTADTWVRRGKFGFDNMMKVLNGEAPASLVNGVKKLRRVPGSFE